MRDGVCRDARRVVLRNLLCSTYLEDDVRHESSEKHVFAVAAADMTYLLFGTVITIEETVLLERKAPVQIPDRQGCCIRDKFHEFILHRERKNARSVCGWLSQRTVFTLYRFILRLSHRLLAFAGTFIEDWCKFLVARLVGAKTWQIRADTSLGRSVKTCRIGRAIRLGLLWGWSLLVR